MAETATMPQTEPYYVIRPPATTTSTVTTSIAPNPDQRFKVQEMMRQVTVAQHQDLQRYHDSLLRKLGYVPTSSTHEGAKLYQNAATAVLTSRVNDALSPRQQANLKLSSPTKSALAMELATQKQRSPSPSSRMSGGRTTSPPRVRSPVPVTTTSPDGGRKIGGAEEYRTSPERQPVQLISADGSTTMVSGAARRSSSVEVFTRETFSSAQKREMPLSARLPPSGGPFHPHPATYMAFDPIRSADDPRLRIQTRVEQDRAAMALQALRRERHAMISSLTPRTGRTAGTLSSMNKGSLPGSAADLKGGVERGSSTASVDGSLAGPGGLSANFSAAMAQAEKLRELALARERRYRKYKHEHARERLRQQEEEERIKAERQAQNERVREKRAQLLAKDREYLNALKKVRAQNQQVAQSDQPPINPEQSKSPVGKPPIGADAAGNLTPTHVVVNIKPKRPASKPEPTNPLASSTHSKPRPKTSSAAPLPRKSSPSPPASARIRAPTAADFLSGARPSSSGTGRRDTGSTIHSGAEVSMIPNVGSKQSLEEMGSPEPQPERVPQAVKKGPMNSFGFTPSSGGAAGAPMVAPVVVTQSVAPNYMASSGSANSSLLLSSPSAHDTSVVSDDPLDLTVDSDTEVRERNGKTTKKTAPEDESQGEPFYQPSGKWTCDFCYADNPAGAARCGACDVERDASF